MDRVKAPLAAMLRAAKPRLDFFAGYRARVTSQSADRKTVDVVPDDTRIPSMGQLTIKHGLPGVTVKVKTGCYIEVRWENGDPARPYAAIWDPGADAEAIAIVVSTKLELGAEGLSTITDGVLNGTAIDPFTGQTHANLGNASKRVFAKR